MFKLSIFAVLVSAVILTAVSAIPSPQSQPNTKIDQLPPDASGPPLSSDNQNHNGGHQISSEGGELNNGSHTGDDSNKQNNVKFNSTGGSDSGPTQCSCVPYYLCDNPTPSANQTSIIDIHGGNPEQCATALEVCCKAPLDKKSVNVPKPIGRQDNCGHRNEFGVGMRIKGDEHNEAQFGEFPWMIGVLIKNKDYFVYKCGGSLIHPQVVLTAAHCVFDQQPDTMYARAGEWDTQTKNELYPHQQHVVKSIVIHEDFYRKTLIKDVALLFLENAFEYTDNVDIICLPQQDEISSSQNCLASGWGKDKFEKEGQYQAILMKNEQQIVEQQTCQDKLRATRLGQNFTLHESFICAGGVPGNDRCMSGDGGSPLVCPVPGKHGKYYQSGIVAWGIGCVDTPRVYANVARFRKWIDLQMKNFNLQTDYNY